MAWDISNLPTAEVDTSDTYPEWLAMALRGALDEIARIRAERNWERQLVAVLKGDCQALRYQLGNAETRLANLESKEG